MIYNVNNGEVPDVGRSLGPAQAKLLLQLAEHFGASFTIGQAQEALPETNTNLARRLRELTTKGWLFSLGRGAYMIAPLEAGPDSQAYAANRYLAAATIADGREHYLSYRTAMELHVMTMHPWKTVYVSTASRLRPRKIQHFIVKPVTIQADRLWGTTRIEVLPDHHVRVSDQARTIVDCLDRPEYAGGLKDIALGLDLLSENFQAENAVEAALHFNKTSVIKRLGVLIDLLAPGQRAVAERMLPLVSNAPHVMDPSLPRSGNLNPRWKIWMNISEEELLQETLS